jgi:hypothetical protein
MTDTNKSGEDETRVITKKPSLNVANALHVQIPDSEREEFHRVSDDETDEPDTLGATENHFILLPHHNEPIGHFALDIGGSLIKMVYLDTDDAKRE